MNDRRIHGQILTSHSGEDWKKKKKEKSESNYFWSLRRVSFLTGSGDIWTCPDNERTSILAFHWCDILVRNEIINQTAFRWNGRILHFHAETYQQIVMRNLYNNLGF